MRTRTLLAGLMLLLSGVPARALEWQGTTAGATATSGILAATAGRLPDCGDGPGDVACRERRRDAAPTRRVAVSSSALPEARRTAPYRARVFSDRGRRMVPRTVRLDDAVSGMARGGVAAMTGTVAMAPVGRE